MPRPSWTDIQHRALQFATRWEGETYEKGESQTFWSEFLFIFDIDRRRHGAFFEYPIKKGNGKQGYIDLFWTGKLLADLCDPLTMPPALVRGPRISTAPSTASIARSPLTLTPTASPFSSNATN